MKKNMKLGIVAVLQDQSHEGISHYSRIEQYGNSKKWLAIAIFWNVFSIFQSSL